MSRVADNPVKILDGVTVDIEGQEVKVDGPKGSLSMTVNALVDLKVEEGLVVFVPNGNDRKSEAMAGTTRALVQNMVLGVSEGFEKRLELQGVGYRAQAKGNQVSLQLGFSHPVDYELPEGISAETPSQTEIVISGTISNKSVRFAQKFVGLGRLNLIRVRVLDIKVNMLGAKRLRKSRVFECI